jgi:hypothetical protein
MRYFPMYLTVTSFYAAFGIVAYLAARRIGVLEIAAAR